MKQYNYHYRFLTSCCMYAVSVNKITKFGSFSIGISENISFCTLVL